MDAELIVIPGFWTVQIEGDAEITARIQVAGHDGNLLGATVEGEDDYRAEGGAFCEGDSKAIGKAVELAVKKTMERLGERLTNSTRIRETALR